MQEYSTASSPVEQRKRWLIAVSKRSKEGENKEGEKRFSYNALGLLFRIVVFNSTS